MKYEKIRGSAKSHTLEHVKDRILVLFRVPIFPQTWP